MTLKLKIYKYYIIKWIDKDDDSSGLSDDNEDNNIPTYRANTENEKAITPLEMLMNNTNRTRNNRNTIFDDDELVKPIQSK